MDNNSEPQTVTDVSTHKALADEIGKYLKHKIVMDLGACWYPDKSQFALHVTTDEGEVIIHATRLIVLNKPKSEVKPS